ncbi:MAG: response regulator [Bacteroidetes bacterium]|nr:MAG: response regulator [Bacteroidota bacterium]
MRKRIIVVDDDASVREIFGIILERAGYDLQLISDANEILKKNFRLPDLFILDKLLSGLDGLDICRFLKSQKEIKDIPVVMVSASPDIGILSQKAGADDYLEKPFEIKHLLKVIERNTMADRKKAFVE